MKKRVHAIAGMLGLTIIVAFFTSSSLVELFGDHGAVATVKQWIVYGLFLLVPAMAVTGASGRALIGRRRGPRLRVKQRRMIAIAVLGLAVLTPCAVVLRNLSAAGDFGGMFVAIQAVELVAGAVNITLMSLNVRDGMLLTGRIRRRRPAPVPVA